MFLDISPDGGKVFFSNKWGLFCPVGSHHGSTLSAQLGLARNTSFLFSKKGFEAKASLREVKNLILKFFLCIFYTLMKEKNM
jgi:hypothetical protein